MSLFRYTKMNYTIAFFICVAYFGVILSKSVEETDPVHPNLKLVVTVDGKSYFAERTAMTWVNAGNYCLSLGMKLASITSQNQADALDNAYSSPDFYGSFWTAGRDSFLPRQFNWNSTEEAVSSSYPNFFNSTGVTYNSCLFYQSALGRNTSYLRPYPCAATNIYVLCET